MLVSLKSSAVAIQSKGPSPRDIPQTTLSKTPAFTATSVDKYTDSLCNDFFNHEGPGDWGEREEEEAIQPLECVPQIFFDPSFALNNPRTFQLASVTDIAECLDTIECHLTNELSQKAPLLASTIDDIKQIHIKSKNLSERLSTLTKSLDSLSKTDPNLLIGLLIKRSNITKLQLAQLHLLSISKAMKSIKLAINDTKLDTALDLVISTKPLLNDLPKVNAIMVTSNSLDSLLVKIGHGYANLMIEIVLRDLLHLDFDSYEILQSLVNKKAQNPIINTKIQSELSNLISKLSLCDQTAYAFKLLHESIISHFRSIYKTHFPQDDQISSLTPLEFQENLINFITNFSHSSRLLNSLKSLFLSLSSNSTGQYLDISPSITTAINYIIRRISKAFKLRELQSIKLSLPHFLKFHKLSTLILKEAELVSNGLVQDFQLTQILDNQLKLFLLEFHKSSKGTCQYAIQKDLWKDEGLPASLQLILDEISSNQPELINWVKPFNLNFINIDNADNNNENKNYNQTKDELSDPTLTKKTLILSDQSFILPPSTTKLLQVIKSYLILHFAYPNSHQIVQSYLPDTLNSINDTILSSVLGTEAIKTAGLKHITTRVVALAAEVCRFWSQVCYTLLRLTSEKKFSTIRTKFNDQLIAYYEKLVSIMHDVVIKLISSENYMEEIIKKILSIAKSIHRYFPDMEYQILMSRIFLDYEEVLSSFFMKNITDSNRTKYQNDVKYFIDKLHDVSGESGVGQRLLILVGGKISNNEDKSTDINDQAKESSESLIGEEDEEDDGLSSSVASNIKSSDDQENEIDAVANKTIVTDESGDRSKSEEINESIELFTEDQKDDVSSSISKIGTDQMKQLTSGNADNNKEKLKKEILDNTEVENEISDESVGPLPFVSKTPEVTEQAQIRDGSKEGNELLANVANLTDYSNETFPSEKGKETIEATHLLPIAAAETRTETSETLKQSESVNQVIDSLTESDEIMRNSESNAPLGSESIRADDKGNRKASTLILEEDKTNVDKVPPAGIVSSIQIDEVKEENLAVDVKATEKPNEVESNNVNPPDSSIDTKADNAIEGTKVENQELFKENCVNGNGGPLQSKPKPKNKNKKKKKKKN